MNLIQDLNLESGFVFTIVWFLVVLLLKKQSFGHSLMSSISFIVTWCVVSLIFRVLCKEYKILCY